MKTYPFSKEPREDDFAGNTIGDKQNNRRSYIFKTDNQDMIEYDLTYLEEHFPELKGKSEETSLFLNKINQVIVQVHTTRLIGKETQTK